MPNDGVVTPAPPAPAPGADVNGAAAPTGSGPARVQQALSAAVSRESSTAAAVTATEQQPVMNGVEGAMHGRTTARKNGDVGSVVIPEVPQNPHDTPIARAAEAAVGVRGTADDRVWPRPAECRIMTIANQKGGVGKTTTAVNLAATLAQHGVRVLIIDLDPQGNASTALDVEHHVGTPSVYNTLVEDRPLADIVRPVEGLPGLYCAPATIDLAGAEIELVPLVARESRLARAVAAYDCSALDYILIDCPPSLGLLTLNALVAAREVLIPIQCEYYALEGLEQLLRTVDLVKGHLNPVLEVSTILLTMYDGRTRLASQVADDVRSHFGEVVLQSIIPRSVRVSEAPSYGQSVITYDPGSSGSVAYVDAARELCIRLSPEMAG
jgi:chromosome partitioning protein